MPLTLVIELVLFAAGIWIYLAATKARDRIGSIGLAGFIALALVLYAGAVSGPPPPSASAIAWTDMGQWLFVLLAALIDRHRGPNEDDLRYGREAGRLS